MTTELATVPTSEVAPLPTGDMLVIAENPGQMQAAQATLLAWFEQKLATVTAELKEAESALETARSNMWKTTSFSKVCNKLYKELTYYTKCRDAVAEGYVIVPDFPVDIVAIRTDRKSPGWSTFSSWRQAAQQSADLNLPSGEGEYIGPEAKVEHAHSIKDTDWWRASEFRDVSLPVKFMKPKILEAAHRAMALRIFDEIGVLPAKKRSDPIVIGRVNGPNGKKLAFLIAWFVDGRDL